MNLGKPVLFRLTLLVISMFGLLAFAEEETYRVITSADGKEMKAWIRKVESDQVTFRREDGRVFTIPLSQLSEDDQIALRAMQKEAPAKPAAPAGTAKANKRLYPRTLDEIKEAAARIRQTAMALKNFTDEEKAALAELNIFRYLSGVPASVTLDRKCCEIADRASEGCAKLGRMSHDAAPEGNSCNLFQSQANFSAMLKGFIEDSGGNNRGVHAHRMWCLRPNLTRTGFGRDSKKKFYAMEVKNGRAGGESVGGGTVAGGFYTYPGEGFYPIRRLRSNGWSVYSTAELPNADPEVTMFQLSARPAHPPAASTMPADAKEVKIKLQKRNDAAGNAGGRWPLSWVVFEPDVKPKAGDIFWVSVKVNSARFSYVVEFIADDL